MDDGGGTAPLTRGHALELRDAIEASVADEHLTPDLARLLSQRVAEDDAANWDEYVTIEQDEREVQARRRPIA
ncbi:hypothetical protein [Microbacterium sp.]|uniref:hypothetical protein n=1 Tax=Microbacterium sp. TaxID=51671 RepID=UPI0039E65185